MMKVFALSIALTLSGAAWSHQLVENGDFEQSLPVGWTEVVQNWGGEYEINRNASYDPDPDHEVMVLKYLANQASLVQTVSIPDLNVLLSADLRFQNQCPPNPEQKYAASALRIEYQNVLGNTIGETRIYQGTEDCDWTGSPVLHLIEGSPQQWDLFRFVLRDELGNLPGVDTSQVEQVRLSLYAYATDAC
jgi:hypothetical protein